jgi:hypothetical protein
MRSEDRSASGFPIGWALAAFVLCGLLWFVATRVDPSRHSFKVGIVGVIGFALLRVLIEIIADAVGEVGFTGLSRRYAWFRPIAFVVYAVVILLYALWSSGSL